MVVDGFEKFLRRSGGDGVGERGDGGRDECEGEVAFHRVGDADDAGFGNRRVGEDCLFDGSCLDIVSCTLHSADIGEETQWALNGILL